jgi:hypothetical protein
MLKMAKRFEICREKKGKKNNQYALSIWMLISVVSEECMSFLYIDTLGGDLVQGM